MFKGSILKELFSTWAERHAFLIGYFEVACPWRAAWPICKKSRDEIKGEYHYYMGGRAAGALCLAFILFGIACLVRDVFFAPLCWIGP